jgi:tetratricopeptide (TPR) repeat protein
MGRRITTVALVVAVAAGMFVVGGVFGARGGTDGGTEGGTEGGTDGGTGTHRTVDGPPVDRLAESIARAQDHLRRVPGDWVTWAALGVAYVERARVTADPTYYPKAEGAARRSLDLRPDGNPDALVALGALANSRHDFSAARRYATAAIAVNAYDADAYAVLVDAQTQLGDTAAATGSVQRLLDLRPGLSAYARASYDLEQRGRVEQATELMRAALAAAVDPHDIAFCRNQLGDLAFATGDLATADREYAAGLMADPSSMALRRGRARLAAARGNLAPALASYAELTRRAPTPSNLLEYAELLRVAGRDDDARSQVELARAAHALFTANGGVDGLTGVALAASANLPDDAVREARAEWTRRQHADVANALGWALHLAGRDSEAVRYARRAVGTGARSADYAYHLGLIELSLGDRRAARDHLARALEVNPYFSPLGAPLARRALAGLATP